MAVDVATKSNNVEEEFTKRGLSSTHLCAEIRRFQQRNKCSEAACLDVVKTICNYFNFPVPNLHKYDKKLQQQAGTSFLRLNGCPKCHKHVYLPTDKEKTCPRVGEDGTVCGHPRYQESGKAFEVFFRRS